MTLIDDTLLYYSAISRKSIRCYDSKLQTDVKEFALKDLYGTEGQELMGILCVNKHFAVYAMQYKKEIVVLRTSDLTHVKTLRGEYANQDEAVEKRAKDLTLYYTGSYATADRFYLLYCGFAIGSSDTNSTIEVYDQEMNPVCQYHLHPSVNRFVVDEANGYIYGQGQNPDYIYRFKLCQTN